MNAFLSKSALSIRFLALVLMLLGVHTRADTPEELEAAPAPVGAVTHPGGSGSQALSMDHPVHVLLLDPTRAASGEFLIDNRDAVPADVNLQAHDRSGALLSVEQHTIAGGTAQALRWAELPAQTISVMMVPLQTQVQLRVQVPPGSPLRLASPPIRERHLTAAEASQPDRVLYNPSEDTATVQLQGETRDTAILWPHELGLLELSPSATGLRLSADRAVVLEGLQTRADTAVGLETASLSGLVTGPLAFGHPTVNEVVTQGFNVLCKVAGVCNGYHSAVDLAPRQPKVDGDPIYNVALGKVQVTQPGTTGFGNHVVVRHLMESGDAYYSAYAHLQANSFLVEEDVQMLKGQQIARMGATGVGTGTHLHFQVRRNNVAMGSGYYPTQKATLDNGFVCPLSGTNSNCSTGFTAGTNGRPLIPYLSRSQATPSAANYDVFGIANAPLQAALPLRPTATRTFHAVGVAGRRYANDAETRNAFLCSEATLVAGSAALTRTSADCCSPTGQTTFAADDYRFFAQSTQFGRGYGLKFSVVPPNSEVIDNDGRLVDTSGNTATANRAGWFTAGVAGTEEVPGYFLTARLLPAGSMDNWARWFPTQSAMTYEIWVHIPEDATATGVRYRIFTNGRPANGACLATNLLFPCLLTDAFNHKNTQDGWVRLQRAGQTSFFFPKALSTNPGHVELTGALITGGLAGVDAIKFIPAPPPPHQPDRRGDRQYSDQTRLAGP